MRPFSFDILFSERERIVAHLLDYRQRNDLESFGAQNVAASLEALFDGDTRARDRRARAVRDVDKTSQRAAVRQKVVHYQEHVVLVDIVFADHDLIVAVIGITVNGGGVYVVGKIYRFALLGKHHRHAELERGHHRDGDTAQCLEALAQAGLAGFEDIPVNQLSAGQQRRVALARLWLTRATLWILDEPFTAIDVNGVDRLTQRMAQHTEQGGIVILTTHQPLNVAESKIRRISLTQTRAA